MRINVEDRALRDPNITKRLPRFTGLNRFDAFGRLLHVWGLCYDARSPFALDEDVNDRAEHEGFAEAMVQAGCAERVDERTIRVRGVDERIGYLKSNSKGGHRGGETRAKQAAAGGRGPGGRFTTVNTTPTVDATTVSDATGVEPNHTSGSSPSPSPSPSPDLVLDHPPTGSEPKPAKAKRGPRSKPPGPMPEDFEPKERHRARARELGLDLDDEVRRFAANHGKRGCLWSDWHRALDEWLEKAPQFSRAGPIGTANHRPSPPPTLPRITVENAT